MSIFGRIKRVKHPSNLRVPIYARDDITPEDVFSDISSPLFSDSDDNKLEISVDTLSANIFFVAIFGLLVFLMSYIIFLGLRYGQEYAKVAEQNAQHVQEMGSARGIIKSLDGVVLAYSELAFNLSINPTKVSEEDVKIISSFLSDEFENFSYDYFYNRINSAKERKLADLLLIKNLSEVEISKVKSILKKYSSLSFSEHPLRVYPLNNSFSHLLGYTAPVTSEELEDLLDYTISDEIGKKGVEYYYENFLRGTKGLFAKLVSAKGDVSEEKILRSVKKGDTIELTLDSQLQNKVRSVLQDALFKYNIDSAAAVVLDPSNGNILAMVSLPDFNPNHFSQGLTSEQAQLYFQDPAKPLFNRVTSGEYATGSVIKPLIAVAALEENIISPSKILYTQGYIAVPSIYDPSVIYRFNDWKNHGAVDMIDAIAVSSNVYFYTIGGGYKEQKGLGIEKIAKYLDKFNWGRKLGIDFASEKEGFVPSPEWKEKTKKESWTLGDTYNASIGQGDVLATPLQVAISTAVFANGGTLFTPNAINKVYTQGSATQDIKNSDIINKNFLSDSSINTVRKGMREAVSRGSSVYLQQLPVSSAGKTGTAQTSGVKNNAWFTGFAPYDNSEIVVTVLLEEGETSNNAVRVAYEIFTHYFKTNYPELYPKATVENQESAGSSL